MVKIDHITDFDKISSKRELFEILKGLSGLKLIRIEDPPKKRPSKLNAYLWAVVYHYASQYTGHSTTYLHELFKDMFLRDMMLDDDEEPSTKHLTGDEMMVYIEKIRSYMLLEHNVKIPDIMSAII